MTRRLIIGMSGASGAIYGIKALEVINNIPDVEAHLVISKSARMTIASETRYSLDEVRSLASQVYDNANIGATLASGSFRTEGMIVAPCSIKTLSAVANCHSGDLMSRAADVVLKERRRLVLMVRETPLHEGHCRLMADASRMGAVIYPPVPAFYANPASLEDMITHSVGRALDLFEIEADGVRRWEGMRLAMEESRT